jgi:hypothetical protein
VLKILGCPRSCWTSTSSNIVNQSVLAAHDDIPSTQFLRVHCTVLAPDFAGSSCCVGFFVKNSILQGEQIIDESLSQLY